MKYLSAVLAAGAVVALLGCVISTKHQIDAHIVVDIRHIEEQASGIVDFIEGESDSLPELETETETSGQSLLAPVLRALNPMPVAHAQDLKSDSPRVRELAEKLRERRPKIDELKGKGVIGEDNRGYVALRPAADSESADAKNAMQQVVSEENSDRKELYKEVVRLNQDANASLSVVEAVFAQQYLKRAKAGEHVQLPPAGKYFDEFKKSPQAGKQGDAAQPGAWIVIK